MMYSLPKTHQQLTPGKMKANEVVFIFFWRIDVQFSCTCAVCFLKGITIGGSKHAVLSISVFLTTLAQLLVDSFSKEPMEMCSYRIPLLFR